MDATRLAGFVPELRIPGIAVVVGTSLIGASAGSLGGPFPAAIFGAVGFAWGVLCVLIAARLIRSPRRATFGNVALYAATFATACLDLSCIRLAMDAAIALLLLGAAFVSCSRGTFA
jgi:hypothetical protein